MLSGRRCHAQATHLPDRRNEKRKSHPFSKRHRTSPPPPPPPLYILICRRASRRPGWRVVSLPPPFKVRGPRINWRHNLRPMPALANFQTIHHYCVLFAQWAVKFQIFFGYQNVSSQARLPSSQTSCAAAIRVLENMTGPLEICGADAADVTEALALVLDRSCIIHGCEPQCNNTSGSRVAYRILRPSGEVSTEGTPRGCRMLRGVAHR